MSVPDHLFRCPTRAAIESLAARLDLPNDPSMQDWEWEVADPQRIDDFIEAYRSGCLDEDERFTLMETIIQSFEDAPGNLAIDPRWELILDLLAEHSELHISTLWYWASLEPPNTNDTWRVASSIRQVLYKQPQYLAEQDAAPKR